MPMQQLFYVSRATVPYDTQVVQTILSQSRRNNRREDVTGCLMFSGCFFAQVLEGRDEAVNAALLKIRRDKRHVDLRLLLQRPVTIRTFGGWSMGYLHDLALEDAIEATIADEGVDVERVVELMSRVRPDTVMGALS